MKIVEFNKATLTVVTSLFAVCLFAGSAHTQGRYVGQYSRADVNQIIRRVEESGDEFRRDFRNEVNRSNLSRSQKSRYRDQAEAFENTTDRLRSNFDKNNSWWESRSQVQDVVTNAGPLNITMNAVNFRRNIERQWNRLRDDLNRLADTYDLPGIAGGGWTGGGGGGPAINPPNWAVGTFYGNGPNGMQVTLTISGNGSVTAIVNGQMSYGRFTRGNNLFINGATSSVTRQGNGFRTVRSDNRERIDFVRGDGGAGGGWNPGNQVAPPSWARGTFSAIASNGSRITLTIYPTGAVTANVNGQLSYGSFIHGNMLAIRGSFSRVTSISRGIRTVRTDTGETINYRRQ